MNDSNAKNSAMNILSGLGLKAEEIPVSNGKSPDLLVHDGQMRWLVEIKEKLEDGNYEKSKEVAFSNGDSHEYTRPTTYTNTFDGIISDAANQLTSYKIPAGTPKVLRAVWCIMRGNDRKLFANQAISTFYGLVDIVEFSGKPEVYHAYYFDESSSFKCRSSIDIAMIDNGDGVAFLVNSHSINKYLVKESILYKENKVPFFDPSEKSIADGILYVDGHHDRRSDHNSIKRIQEKYGLVQISAIRMKEFSASIRFKREEIE